MSNLLSDQVKVHILQYQTLQVLSSDALDYQINREILADALMAIAKNMMEIKK